MASRSSDTCEFGRRCELDWQKLLISEGYFVTPLCEAIGNTPGTAAPMLNLPGGRKVRSPDFQSESPSGVFEYWEVKGKSRQHQSRLTGDLVHYTDLARFNDYYELFEARGKDVWLVVYESPSSTASGKWMKIHVREARAFGFAEERIGPDGHPVKFWNWPVARMELTSGPGEVNLNNISAPILESEIEAPSPTLAELIPAEQRIRSADTTNGSTSPVDPHERLLDSDPRAALETLRQRLRLPKFPRYSVLRIGSIEESDLVGLLHHGIRVFLIVDNSATRERVVNCPNVARFVGPRILECAVAVSVVGRSSWFVDGVVPRESWLDTALAEADAHGGMNVQQFKIVHASTEVDIAVSAGAGTGKTETMSERILFLLSTSVSEITIGESKYLDGLRLEEIALVTFTREAAGQMRKRIARTIGLRQRLCKRCIHPTLPWLMQLSQCRISTIHMFAKALLQDFGAAIGYAPGVRISNLTMQYRVIRNAALSKELLPQYKVSRANSGYPPAFHAWSDHLDAVWDGMGNNGISLLGDQAEVDWGGDSTKGNARAAAMVVEGAIRNVGAAFAKTCMEHQAVPTSQLVPSALRAVKDSQERTARRPIRYLFVDEFQDTDALQMALLLEVRSQPELRMFVVGDAKQGIYRFRGAHGNAFEELTAQTQQRHMDAFETFPLNRNFRSGKKLLDDFDPFFSVWGAAGRTWIPYASADKLRHDPISRRESSLIDLQPATPNTYARRAAQLVSSWRHNHPKKSIGILCRRNSHAKLVASAIREFDPDLKPRLVVGGEFYVTRAVHEARALIQALLMPDDDAALLELMETRWANGLRDKHDPIPPVTEGHLSWQFNIDAVIDWKSRLGSMATSGRYDRADLKALRDRVLSLRSLARNMSPIAFLIQCNQILRPASVRLTPKEGAEERFDYERNLNHLFALMEENLSGGSISLSGMLQWLVLQIGTNREVDEPASNSGDGTRLDVMTVHRAKGDEFDFVLIPNTWTKVGPPQSAKTEVTVASSAGAERAVRWRWHSPNGKFENSSKGDDLIWSLNTQETEREEARLLYVAMTRAKSNLTVFMHSYQRGQDITWGKMLDARNGVLP